MAEEKVKAKKEPRQNKTDEIKKELSLHNEKIVI